ncbi:Ser-Thr-rich glycosyl-phosphatidyl-inositol-anchored membrane family-domain-containing protein [Aspergillus avenaceus]|uniref:Ser-Thr-rich glycosyl-phosphatidyl-inositol-anchored membrane family-domain-containing protein n=1 Tax=Aspergillus avenaceus TaxID=36643 RepID=A0A5N6TX89_ASPAV|nr:Ser-Thr-rich glycosyl-phosphatidyl-inositol-anchored membrane family-domain-containing protein [Aspergillus avenaceus]
MRSVFYLALSAIATLAAAASSANPFKIPSEGYSFESGQSTTLNWTPTSSGTITLKLQWGSVMTSNTGTTIAKNIANSGSYTWSVPSNLAAQPDYTVEIIDDDDTSQSNYLPRFTVAGATDVATTASSTSTASTSSSTGSSSTESMTESKTTTTGSSTQTPTTLSTVTGTTSGSSSTASSTGAASTSGAGSTTGTSTGGSSTSTAKASSTNSASASASTTTIANVNAGMANRVSGGMLAIVLGAIAVL